jgi:transposase
MNISGNSVGIDYHEERVQVSILDSTGRQLGNRSLVNEVEEVARYVASFGAIKGVALEACNGAASFADELSLKGGCPVRLAHPGFVNRMKRGLDKTDHGDAQVLGDLLRVGYLPEVWLAPECIRDLRNLVRYREACVCKRRNVKLRIRALLSNNRIRRPGGLSLWTLRGMVWLNGEIGLPAHGSWILKRYLHEFKQIVLEIRMAERRLAEVAKTDTLIQHLMMEKGIGLVTAGIMRAEIGRFDRFRTGKQFARFCGLTPRNASSGKRQADAGVISAGNPLLKRALIQGAHSRMRYDAETQQFVSRLLENGKPKPVVVVAVANRWMRKLFYQYFSEETAMAA